ncbi:MAG: hypothetical protein PHH13_01515 [Candidatus Peribacteraceae bacterium]|nr:hypothetical protein [Candidatus Peribacteraceae bacterium]
MFCIAAFIVFAILSVFSATYRPLAAKAWHCVIRRVTFRPCDISFSDEVKGRLIGKMILTHPRWARFLDRWIDWLAFAFVLLSIWSVVYLAVAGLNLWVWGTCRPANVESCSLSGEACGVNKYQINLLDAVREGRIGEWAVAPFAQFAETVSRIPDRLKRWEAADYLPPTATYSLPKDPTKPYALEVLDPGCTFCRKLLSNIQSAGFENRYNFTYILYPIPDAKKDTGYKFAKSLLLAQTIEAVKMVPLKTNSKSIPPDWQLLEIIFNRFDPDGLDLQTKFNIAFTTEQAQARLKELLKEIGYGPADITKITRLAAGDDVIHSLSEQKEIVENRLHTIKIPTLVFDGRRYDRVVDVKTLK